MNNLINSYCNTIEKVKSELPEKVWNLFYSTEKVKFESRRGGSNFFLLVKNNVRTFVPFSHRTLTLKIASFFHFLQRFSTQSV